MNRLKLLIYEDCVKYVKIDDCKKDLNTWKCLDIEELEDIR